jgi:hypothetical protein
VSPTCLARADAHPTPNTRVLIPTPNVVSNVLVLCAAVPFRCSSDWCTCVHWLGSFGQASGPGRAFSRPGPPHRTRIDYCTLTWRQC